METTIMGYITCRTGGGYKNGTLGLETTYKLSAIQALSNIDLQSQLMRAFLNKNLPLGAHAHTKVRCGSLARTTQRPYAKFRETLGFQK